MEPGVEIKGGVLKSSRAKGLDYVREVRKILEGIGHIVEGPGYGVAYFNARMNPIHKDFFGCFDLMSFNDGKYYGHQVSTQANKSTKIKTIQEANLPGWVWCRFTDEDGSVGYQVYVVERDQVVEMEMVYGIRRRKPNLLNAHVKPDLSLTF